MILFVGPLPPPLHGFSQITSSAFELIKRTGSVYLINRAGNFSLTGFFVFFLRTALLVFLFPFGKIDYTYLALSGGRGQAIDAIYLIFSLLFRKKTVIHHHSFNYINKHSRLFEFVLMLSRNSIHVFLCQDMLDRVRSIYNVDLPCAKVISNAAFLDFGKLANERRLLDSFVVGFLSNITEEKGIFSYLDVMKILADAKVNVRGLVAGPLDSSIEHKFLNSIADNDLVEYIGPVYGDDKLKFFSRIDILLFPTKYKNEAEPLVILEALSHGIPVVAGNRGCIPCLIGPDFGFVSDRDFSPQAAVEAIVGFAVDKAIYQSAAVAALEKFRILKENSSSIFKSLL